MKVSEAIKKRVFWDVNPDELDWKKDAHFIITRTFVRGDTFDVRAIFSKYNDNEIKEAVIKSRNVLTSKVANYLSLRFSIPYSKINVAPEYY